MADLSALTYLESTERTKLNQQAWENITAGESGTVTTPTGTVRKTLGQLELDAEARISNLTGFEPPVDYEADLEITTRAETVSYEGAIYALRSADLAPYTTPETFDPTKWVLVVKAGTVPAAGTVANVAALKLLVASDVAEGDLIRTRGYSTAGFGSAIYRVLLGSASANSLTANDGTVVENTAGTVTFVIDHEGPVRLSWFGAACDGSTDDSLPFSKAIQTGKSIAIPSGRNTVIGTGTTPLPALVSYQSIVSDNPTLTTNATLTLQQPIIVGTTTTRSNENSIGSGISIAGAEGVTLFNLVYNRKFVISEGVTCSGVHRLAALGSASAAGASYVFYNFGDIRQRYAYIVLSGVSGSWTVGETVTGGTSGATAKVEQWEAGAGKLTLREVSSTVFTVSETVTGGSSGATGTITSRYRPTHLIQVINHAGDFWSRGTVEGAYCGNANGLDISSNAHVRFDEFRIEKYWARFQIGLESTNARSVNGHLYADMEGCLLNTVRFYTTNATVRPTSEVGFANIYGRIKVSVLAGGDCGALFRSDRASVASETVNLDLQTSDQHTVHGARILCSAGNVDSISLTVRGTILPASANQYGVDIQQSGTGAINAVNVDASIEQAGATAVGACVNIAGTAVTGRIRKPVSMGTVTQQIRFVNQPPIGLHFDVSESGIPIGSAQMSDAFYLENIPTGVATTYLKRGGLVTAWEADRDMYIVRAITEYESAPTAGELSFIIEVDSSDEETEPQSADLWQEFKYLAGDAIFVARNSIVKLKVTGTGSYASSGVDMVARLEYIPLWNDA